MVLQDKVIVVTGAGGGIGSALALGLLERGARVVAVDLRDEALQRLRAQAGDAADRLSLRTINITDKTAVAALPQTVIETFETIDGLINCAGIIQPFVKVNDLSYDAIERVMNVNFYGTLYMVKAFLPQLLQRPEAHLVNVSSMGGFLPVPGQGVYGASKAAVKLLTEALYAELLTTNVHVTVVFPGATQTDITKNSGVDAPGGASADMQKMPMLSAEAAAGIILDGVEKNKPQIFTGKDSRMMNKLYRLAPTYATRLIAKRMQALLG
ncbi:SDR family oxidoreductase [Candidatus Saccharibacteria bacterium]|nr:SDR family oxidoreductase [Candidatus Saccharibacteria bacterium]